MHRLDERMVGQAASYRHASCREQLHRQLFPVELDAYLSFQQGDVLVFGGESRGLPPSLLAEYAERCLRIPIRPEARSLNLSVSVAVAAFEARRQQDS